MESNALRRNSQRRNLQKSGIDCNVTAFVSGLRCTLSKTAVQRNPLQKFKIPTLGTVLPTLGNVKKEDESREPRQEYLGIQFDKCLRFREHIDSVV